MLNRQFAAAVVLAAALMFAGAQSAQAATVITGTVVNQKYLLTGATVNVTTNAVLKISFEVDTAGINLALCAGNVTDFEAGTCGTRLSDSGGPGFKFLTITDAASLNGKQLYILKEVGSEPASFTFSIE